MIKNFQELKAANELFFSPAAMEFFNSEIMTEVYPTWHGAFFVTCERMDTSEPRCYTVRYMSDDGHEENVSVFREYRTLTEAKHHAHQAAKGMSNQG